MLQKSATLAKDINRLVCGHPLHLDLHCLQYCLSKYDVAWVNFCFFIYLKLCRRNFYRLHFFCALTISERHVDCELIRHLRYMHSLSDAKTMSLMTSGGSDVLKSKCR